MLFDLRGKRRRFIQAIYAFLAILLGGGLVFFGIGGDAAGGLADMFGLGQQSGGRDTDQTKEFREQEESIEARIRLNPDDPALYAELARVRYLAGTTLTDTEVIDSAAGREGTIQVSTAEARREYRRAVRAWNEHLGLAEEADAEPDANVAQLMVNAFDDLLANERDGRELKTLLEGAATAAQVVAEDRPAPGTLYAQARYETLAGIDGARDTVRLLIEESPEEAREDIATEFRRYRRTAREIDEAVEAGEALQQGGRDQLQSPVGPGLGQQGQAPGGQGGLQP